MIFFPPGESQTKLEISNGIFSYTLSENTLDQVVEVTTRMSDYLLGPVSLKLMQVRTIK